MYLTLIGRIMTIRLCQSGYVSNPNPNPNPNPNRNRNRNPNPNPNPNPNWTQYYNQAMEKIRT